MNTTFVSELFLPALNLLCIHNEYNYYQNIVFWGLRISFYPFVIQINFKQEVTFVILGKYNMEIESDIRLVGGNVPYEGRVEVLYKGWHNICLFSLHSNCIISYLILRILFLCSFEHFNSLFLLL